jgi:hypothetical protein
MNKLFPRTNLPRCENDWCTRVIVMQYLQDYRKNLARSQKAAKRDIADLPDADVLEEEYRREAVSGDPDNEEDGWVDVDEDALDGKQGAANGTGGADSDGAGAVADDVDDDDDDVATASDDAAPGPGAASDDDDDVASEASDVDSLYT